MTCDTESKELEERFNYFMLEIQPHIQVWSDKLNRKLVDCPFTSSLDAKKYFTFLRSIRKQIDLFREPNIPLIAALSVLQQQFGVIAGKMTKTNKIGFIGGKDMELINKFEAGFAAGVAGVWADTLKAAPQIKAPMSWVLICFITEDRFMLALPRSVGSRVIVLPILGASFELLGPAVLVAGFPVRLGEHLHACACVRRGVQLRLAGQFLGFVAASCKACYQKQSAGKT